MLSNQILSPVLSNAIKLQWDRFLLEELIDPQLDEKFWPFNETQRVITVFTRAHNVSLCWARQKCACFWHLTCKVCGRVHLDVGSVTSGVLDYSCECVKE